MFRVKDDSGVCFLLGCLQVIFFSNIVTCESEAKVITYDIHNFTTQFFSHAGLLPLADDELISFILLAFAGQKTSLLQDLATRNNVSKTYSSF